MGEKAADKLKQEEDRVDGDHNLDASALGPRHHGGDAENLGARMRESLSINAALMTEMI